MVEILVTGANGHIGCNVVRACLDAGHAVVGFVRPGSDRRGLAGLDVRLCEGDLRDASSVLAAMKGVDIVMHVGAVHRNYASDPNDILRPGIEGTRNVLAAARACGVARVVHCSSAATVGFSPEVARPLDERSSRKEAKSAYIQAKIGAEQLALEAAREGLDVVVLNPSGVFGPLDYRGTPATRALVGLLQGDPLFFGLCVTDVRDVARAHVLAAERGVRGERYLITGDNLAPRELSALIASLSGVRPMTFRPPRWLLRLLVGRMERAAVRTGVDPAASLDALDDLGKGHLVYDASKSRRVLGMSYRPAREVLQGAFCWLLERELLKPSVAARLRAKLGESAAVDGGSQRNAA